MLKHSWHFHRSLVADRTFLLYFNLPNSPISAVDEDEEISISTPSLESSVEEPTREVTTYPTFFSELPHK